MEVVRLKRGLDIKLVGEAQLKDYGEVGAEIFAIFPDDYRFFEPRLEVKVGDEVEVGSVLLVDKHRPWVKVVSPVSGHVEDILRGKRRKLLEVRIKVAKEFAYKHFEVGNWRDWDGSYLRQVLIDSGMWSSLLQRPFGVIPDQDSKPKAIHISTFDTAPLAPDYQYIFADDLEALQVGVEVLAKAGSCPVFLNLDARVGKNIFSQIKGVRQIGFVGPHPSGNVGVQVHHLTPVTKDDSVWTIDLQEVVFIGRLFLTGKLDFRRRIALAGSCVRNRGYYSVLPGVNLRTLLENNLLRENCRVISGNVLTGKKERINGFLHRFDNMITVIPEGNYSELFGWLKPGWNKYSFSRTFLGHFRRNKKWDLDTNMHGQLRPFVLTGLIDKVLPMRIMPEFLLKAIIAEDIEKMENLGIYDVIEEDLALSEFVCSSKIEIQQLVRKGIKLMLEQLS